MSRSHDLAHASIMALAAEAPDSILGTRQRGRWIIVDPPGSQVYPETTEQQARNNFLAAANDAPGAVVGSVGCCCPVDTSRSLIDSQLDCGKHGERVRVFHYETGKQRKLWVGRLIRPRGLGRA